MKLDAYAASILIGVFSCSLRSVAAPQGCTIALVQGKNDEYSVQGDDGSYLGYVALEKDGTWYAWVDGHGGQNTTYRSRDQAVDAVCNAKRD